MTAAVRKPALPSFICSTTINSQLPHGTIPSILKDTSVVPPQRCWRCSSTSLAVNEKQKTVGRNMHCGIKAWICYVRVSAAQASLAKDKWPLVCEGTAYAPSLPSVRHLPSVKRDSTSETLACHTKGAAKKHACQEGVSQVLLDYAGCTHLTPGLLLDSKKL